MHPLTVNAQSPNKDAAKQFLSFLYRQENYSELLQRALDVIPAYPAGMSPEYVATLPWVSGYQSVNALSPTVLLGDFIYNNQEFGQYGRRVRFALTRKADAALSALPTIPCRLPSAWRMLDARMKACRRIWRARASSQRPVVVHQGEPVWNDGLYVVPEGRVRARRHGHEKRVSHVGSEDAACRGAL